MSNLKTLMGKLFGLSKIQFEGEVPPTGKMYKDFMSVAWPAMVEGALISVINSIDTMMVGSLGSTAIAAVGLTNQPRLIMLIIAMALNVGITAVIARRKGAGDREAANDAFSQAFGIIILLGILMVVIGYVSAPFFMNIAGAQEDTIELSTTYFRIISLGFIFNTINFCICAAMRAIGNTRITMVTNLSANGVNVVLNYCLIGGHFGFPALGVTGAAIATLIGTIVASLIALVVALRPGGYLRLRLMKIFCFRKETLSSIWKVGSASIAESAFLRLGFLIFSKMIAGIGTAAFASYQIVMQVTSLSFTLGDGLGTAATTMIGQSLGANRKDLAKANVSIAGKLGIVVSTLLMIFIFAFHRQLGMLFTDEEVIIEGVSLAFFVIIIGMIPQNGRVIYSGCLRGAGDTRYVAWGSLISVCVVRLFFTWFFCYPMNQWFPGLRLDVCGPWLAFDVDAFVRHFMYKFRIKKGKWADIKL